MNHEQSVKLKEAAKSLQVCILEQDYLSSKEAKLVANEIQKDLKEFLKDIRKKYKLYMATVISRPALVKGSAEGPNSHVAGYEFRVIIK